MAVPTRFVLSRQVLICIVTCGRLVHLVPFSTGPWAPVGDHFGDHLFSWSRPADGYASQRVWSPNVLRPGVGGGAARHRPAGRLRAQSAISRGSWPWSDPIEGSVQ